MPASPMMESSGKRAKAMDIGDRIGASPTSCSTTSCPSCRRGRRAHVRAVAEVAPPLGVRVRLNVDAEYFAGERRFVEFVDNLLSRRVHAPLDMFRLRAGGWADISLDDLHDTANLWIRHALRSNVQVLGIIENYKYDYFGGRPATFCLDRHSFTSSHLKRLHLHFVWVDNRLVKQPFFGCPELEDLEMIHCDIIATEFSSTILKNLSIGGLSDQYSGFARIVIHMPSLVSLQTGDLIRKTASLMDVQSLVTASISLDEKWLTFADSWYFLGALSNVKNLELLFPNFEAWKYLLGSDMLRCQVIFTNLTTLSLDEWCLHGRCKALFYVLKHSPNLEKLTLKLYE